MASDGSGDAEQSFEGFALTLNVPTEADADPLFSALADGGQVLMPLAKTFYSPRFGMVTDRFGILWMILTAEQTRK
jgi:PhnB protein